MAEPRRLSRLAEPGLRALASAPPGPLVVAISGGADSAAAAWLATRSGRRARAVHVHHGLPHSDVMADAAGGVAERLRIGLEVVGVTVPAGPSFEGLARTERLGALESTRQAGEWIVTGHTRDDQVETILMRLVRGTGLDGLAGIARIRGPYVRPLLDLSRSETRELASLAGLPWRDDPSNLDDRHLRNRIRRSLLPSIEDTFGTGVAVSLARVAEQAAADVEVLEQAAAIVPRQQRPGGVRLPAGALAAVPKPVAARAIRSAFVALDPPYPPTASIVGRVLGVGKGERILAGNVEVWRDGPWLVLSTGSRDVPDPVPLVLPGTVVWGEWRIEATSSILPTTVPLSPAAALLPAGRSLTVRAALPGDAIAIGRGHKRVFDALAEAAVPIHDRHRYPVVVAGDETVWIPAVRRLGWSPGSGERYLCAVATKDTQWQRFGS